AADGQVGELRSGGRVDPAGVLQVSRPDLADRVLDAAGSRLGGGAGRTERHVLQPVRDAPGWGIPGWGIVVRHRLLPPGGRGWRPAGPRTSRNGRRVGVHHLPSRRLPGGSRVRSTASLPASTRDRVSLPIVATFSGARGNGRRTPPGTSRYPTS